MGEAMSKLKGNLTILKLRRTSDNPEYLTHTHLRKVHDLFATEVEKDQN